MLDELLQVLLRRRLGNPVLVGASGVGKSAIVQGLALRIARAEVPEPLFGLRLLELDVTLLLAGTKYRGQFEERVRALTYEIRRTKNVVLVLDRLHELVGSGDAGDLLRMLRPAFDHGDLHCIATSTPAEFDRLVVPDTASARCFRRIDVHPSSVGETQQILRGLRDRYEAHHSVRFSDEALDAAAELALVYAPTHAAPSGAVMLLDEAGSRMQAQAQPPREFRELTKRIAELDRQRDELVLAQEFEQASKCRDEAWALHRKLEEQTQHRQAQQAQVTVVGEQHIVETIRALTGLEPEAIRKHEPAAVHATPPSTAAASRARSGPTITDTRPGS